MNAALYYLYLIFFLTHIPITLFVDSQAGLSIHLFPALPLHRACAAGPASPSRAAASASWLQCCRRHGSRRRPRTCRRGTSRHTRTHW